MKKYVAHFLIIWLIYGTALGQPTPPPGVGAARLDIYEDVELLAMREDALVKSLWFTKLKWPQANAYEGATRLLSDEVEDMFCKAELEIKLRAQALGLTPPPIWILRAIAYLESNAVWNAKSPTGPLGYMQFARKTAQSEDLFPCSKFSKSGKCLRYARYPDGRLDPYSSIVAAGMHLAKLYKSFHTWPLSVWAYHSGAGVVNKMLAHCQSRGLLVTSPTQILFGVTPFTETSLYQQAELLASTKNGHDQSLLYWHRVLASNELLRVGQKDLEQLHTLYVLAQDPGNTALPLAMQKPYKNRFAWWTDSFYSQAPNSTGIKLVVWQRTISRDTSFFLASPYQYNTVSDGLAKYISEQWHQLLKKIEYSHIPLSTPNSAPAVIAIEEHNLSAKHRVALKFLLEDLGYAGIIGVRKEKAGPYLVCPAPEYLEFFTLLGA